MPAGRRRTGGSSSPPAPSRSSPTPETAPGAKPWCGWKSSATRSGRWSASRTSRRPSPCAFCSSGMPRAGRRTDPIVQGRDRYAIVLEEKAAISPAVYERAHPPVSRSQHQPDAAQPSSTAWSSSSPPSNQRRPHHRGRAAAPCPDLDWARIHLLVVDPGIFRPHQACCCTTCARASMKIPASAMRSANRPPKWRPRSKQHLAAGNFQTAHHLRPPDGAEEISSSGRFPTPMPAWPAPTCWPARRPPPSIRRCSTIT